MQSPAPTVIELHDVTVTYNQKPALWDIDFEIPAGKFVGVIGPNGSGKSTLIKAIMGLLPLSSGFVKLYDQPLENVRSKVSYVPQRETIDWDFPASVLDIALMGTYRPKQLLRRISSADRDLAMECLKKVRMEGFAHRQIAQLSGGQQQRVFLARALAQQADMYFMDEPFAGVDAATERAILDLLSEMRQQGKTIVVVHHDLKSAAEYFDWIVMLNTRLVAAGAKEDVFRPEFLQEAYGGQLSILAQVGNLLYQKQFPIREDRGEK